MGTESIQFNYLIPGDILLFSARNPSWRQRLIITVQSAFYRAKEGYSNITHAAIYVGDYKGKQACIAHVLGNGYIIEPLNEYLYSYSNMDPRKFRPFNIYRAIDATFRAKLMELALSPDRDSQNISWSIPKAVRCLNGLRSQHPQRSDQIRTQHSPKSFCSRFTIETLQLSAVASEKNSYFPSVRANSSTRTLQNYLKKSSLYSHFVVLDVDPSERIMSYISLEASASAKKMKNTDCPSSDKAITNELIMGTALSECFSRCEGINDSYLKFEIISQAIKKTGGADLTSQQTKKIEKTVKKERKKFTTLKYSEKSRSLKEPQCYSLESGVFFKEDSKSVDNYDRPPFIHRR